MSDFKADFDISHLPACLGCHHTPGEHAIGPFPSDPRPCEVPGCGCEGLVVPERMEAPVMRQVKPSWWSPPT